MQHAAVPSLPFPRLYAEALKHFMQIIGASLFIAICAQIEVRLPFTPVPLTLQTLGVMFVGAKLGSRKGLLALLVYIAEAAAGLPVLAGGAGSMASLIGPTGGYIVGFGVQAYLAGLYFELFESRSAFLTFVCLSFIGFIQMGIGCL